MGSQSSPPEMALAQRAERYSRNDDESFPDDFRSYLDAIKGRGWTRAVSRELTGDDPDPARDVAWWMLQREGSVKAIRAPAELVLSTFQKWTDGSPLNEGAVDTATGTVDVFGIVDEQATVVQVGSTPDEDGQEPLDADRSAALSALVEGVSTDLRIGIYDATDRRVSWLAPEGAAGDDDVVEAFETVGETSIAEDGPDTAVHDLSRLPPSPGTITGIAVLVLYQHFIVEDGSRPLSSEDLRREVALALDVTEGLLVDFDAIMQSSPMFSWTKLTNQRTVHLDVAGIAHGAALRSRLGESVPVSTTLRALAESRANLLQFFGEVTEAAVSARREGGILPSFTDDDAEN